MRTTLRRRNKIDVTLDNRLALTGLPYQRPIERFIIAGDAAGERHEFKVTDGSWGWAQPGSGNSWFFADAAGNIDITFNENVVADGWVGEQYRMGLSTDPGAWSIVGSLNGWVNNDPLWATTPQGGGIYKLTQSLMAGSYDWKAVVTGSWDAISSERSVNADNLNLTLAVDSDVDFYVDALTGTVKAEIIPEPATMALLGLGALLIRRKK